MNVVVCVKQVPDTTEQKFYGEDLRFRRGELDAVINPFDEYAIEEALRLRDDQEGAVVALTMGPPSAEEQLRRALAMGCDSGILVTDEALAGSDWLATARVLSAAIRSTDFDLVLTGTESTDARTGLVPAGLAELLGVPAVTQVSSLSIDGDGLRVTRQIPGGYEELEGRLPAVVSVVKGVNEPRYPSLKGIMAAKRKEIARPSLADLGIDPSEVGYGGARTEVVAVEPRPARQQGVVVQGGAAADLASQIADFLHDRKYL